MNVCIQQSHEVPRQSCVHEHSSDSTYMSHVLQEVVAGEALYSLLATLGGMLM